MQDGKSLVQLLRIEPELTYLAPLLQEFFSLLRLSGRAFPQSADLWFNERTMAGLLCSAAWRLSWPSINEAKTKRQYECGFTGSGHVDVLIDVEGKSTAVEMKIAWFGHADGAHRLLENLAEAERQTATLPQDLDVRLALGIGVVEGDSEAAAAVLKGTLAVLGDARLDVLAQEFEDTDARGEYRGHVVIGRLCRNAE